jgi:hypothetical protein
MHKIFYPIFQFFVLSQLFISFAAVAFLETNLLILEQKTSFAVYLLVFCATFCTYNLHIFYAKDRQNMFYSFYLCYSKFLKIGFGFACFIILFCFCLLETIQKIALIHLAIISFFYTFSFALSIPLTTQKIIFPSLRKIPYTKIFLIAYTWSFVSVVLPSNFIVNTHLISCFCANFCFLFAITLPFDWRDRQADITQNTKTLVQKITLRQTKLLILVSLVAQILVLIAVFPLKIWMSLAICNIMVGIWLSKLSFTNSFWYFSVFDGMLFLQYFLLSNVSCLL